MNYFQTEFARIKAKYESGDHQKEKQSLKQQLLSRQVVLYGLGFFGGVIVKNFNTEGIPVACFCDSKKTGIDQETGLQIITPSELREKYSQANVVISVANPNNEKSVYETILSLGIAKEQIYFFHVPYCFIRKSRVELVSLPYEEVLSMSHGFEWAYNFFKDEKSKQVVLDMINGYLFNTTFTYDPPQDSYFPNELSLHDHEVFIDGGLYTGDTTEDFIRRVNGKYSKVVGFDIDEKNLASAKVNLQKYENVEIVPKGLWNKPQWLNAELGIMAGSNVNENAKDLVELTALDTWFMNTPPSAMPTYIKLDVEGSEKEALAGAKNIIQSAAPKLAVCVYHKPEDVYAVMQLLHEYNPDYKFFLRHYSPYVWDSVLYAYQD